MLQKALKILVKILFMILTIFQQPANGESCPVNSLTLQAFRDHLEFNHLKHIIFIQNNTMFSTIRGQQQSSVEEDYVTAKLLSQFANQYYVQIFNAINSHKDFLELFDRNTIRVGLFVRYASTSTAYQEMNKILLLASEHEKFNYSSSWFIVMEYNDNNNDRNNNNNNNNNVEHMKRISEEFGNFNIMLNADVTVAIPKNNCTLDLYDIYKICHKCGTPLEVEYKGNWSVQNGLQIEEKFKNSFVTRRRDLQNITVNVATTVINYTPDLNMTLMDYLNDHKRYMQNDVMARKTYQLMSMMKPWYNLGFNLLVNDTWGFPENGTWNGVVGALAYGYAEFSVCPLRFQSRRTLVLRFSPEVHFDNIQFIFRHPKHATLRNIFLEPLVDNVWWCILGLIVTTTCLLAIHVYAEYKIYMQKKKLFPERNADETIKHHEPNNLIFIILTILEAIFMQGPSPQQFRNNSTRVLLISLSVFSVMLMQFYGAFIVSSLISEAPRTITTMAALYNSSLNIGMENITYNFEIFINTSDAVAYNMYKYRICKKGTRNIVTLEEGLRRVVGGGFAIHISLDRFYFSLKDALTQNEFCELQEVTFNPPFGTALGLSKQSAFNEYVTTSLLRFRETSLLQHNNQHWKVTKWDCTDMRKEVEVDLVHFAPVLVFLAFAIFTSLSVCFAENLYQRTHGRVYCGLKIIYKTMRKYLANKR